MYAATVVILVAVLTPATCLISTVVHWREIEGFMFAGVTATGTLTGFSEGQCKEECEALTSCASFVYSQAANSYCRLYGDLGIDLDPSPIVPYPGGGNAIPTIFEYCIGYNNHHANKNHGRWVECRQIDRSYDLRVVADVTKNECKMKCKAMRTCRSADFVTANNETSCHLSFANYFDSFSVVTVPVNCTSDHFLVCPMVNHGEGYLAASPTATAMTRFDVGEVTTDISAATPRRNRVNHANLCAFTCQGEANCVGFWMNPGTEKDFCQLVVQPDLPTY